MRADAFGPAAVTRLACATRAPFATPWRRHRRRAGQHRRDRSQALRAELRDKARRALSPPVLGSRCGVNCPEGQFNITGCCTRCGHSRAGRARCPHRVQPPLCLAPTVAPARGIGSDYRAHAPPIPMLVRTRSTGCASHQVRRRKRRSHGVGPARPPSAPRGGSLALSTALTSVAPCSPRQGQALRARGYARP